MQFFLTMVHDNCYHILGNAGTSLGLQFYQHPHLADYLIQSSLANLHLVPDYRLRPIIRTFLKPFIQRCPPPCYQTVLLPILNHLCPYSKLWLQDGSQLYVTLSVSLSLSAVTV